MKDEDKTKEQLIKELVQLRKQLAEMGVHARKPDKVSIRDEAEEPWLPIETRLVVRSLIGGMIALIVLATLVNMFLLGGQ